MYKVHDNEDCEDLLNLTRYLYYKGIDIRPLNVQEREFPTNVVNNLPVVILMGKMIIYGLDKIVLYYEKTLKMNNLLEDSKAFNEKNPNYRITDKSTWKNLFE